MSSSERLDQVLERYHRPFSSQYPEIKELRQLLSNVTHDEKVRLLSSHSTLYRAALDGHTEIITAVLSSVPLHQRLDVLLVDECTPLHIAALYGKSGCVETILTYLTPDQQLEILTARNQHGRTPADRALQGRYKKTERLLRDYQQRAEKQTNAVRKMDDNNQVSSLARELQQTKLQLDNQAKDIQTLVSAVTELDSSNKNKDEILQKITEESRALKSTVQDMKEEINKQTTEAANCQTENGEQQDQILQQQTEITNLQEKTTNICNTVDELRATGDARGRKHQDDLTKHKLHHEMKLTEQQAHRTGQQEQITQQQEQITQQREQITQQQEQITRQREQIARQQAQIDVIMSTVNVRNLAIGNLNDRHGYLREDVDRIDETVDNLTGTVERIDEHFYPESNAVGRGAPHDGGDEVIVRVIEEQWTVPQSATNG